MLHNSLLIRRKEASGCKEKNQDISKEIVCYI